MLNVLKNLWFRDTKESVVYINETAVRMRAGILLIIPIFMGLTMYDVVYTSHWIVDSNTAVDTYDTDWDDHIIYAVEATKRTYEYSIQTIVLFYALFEMLVGMFIFTSRFSPTILLCSFFTRNAPPVWKPLVPKRFAWGMGASFITICILFFNPDVFAVWVNELFGSQLLPETQNFIPYWIPINLIWACLLFIWLEAVFGFCIGCKIHSLLVFLRILKVPCEECGNIDWDEIARKHKEKQASETATIDPSKESSNDRSKPVEK
ncbi:MAG: hypothetical protein ISEC1_P1160 [Thiomicrorhabdus sp.]|nr:MAG: hypothetical protein ISEC1_P1160 [Thiomicrorhabdus sp.]